MPELPEVETVRNTLKQLIIGKQIMDVTATYPNIIRNVSFSHFRGLLINEELKDIKRKGKFLIFVFSNNILVSHLRMEGKFQYKTTNEIEKHEHVIFWFTDQSSLHYHDTRKFGTMHLFPTTNLEIVNQLEPLVRVGLEPMDEAMSVAYLKEKLHKTKRPIKSVLLDQSIVAGLGNIYVNEVLFLSKINPTTPANTLTLEMMQTLIDNSRLVLNKAIALGGTTIRTFTSSHEVTGRFQNELFVHTKTICPICQSPVIKIKVGGRGTYLCEKCQKPLT
jgi:formamidopyrimidine-DNA glycosylase